MALTGKSIGTLKNVKYVAAEFEKSRRRDLSWTHHREAASLPSEVRDEVLAEAEDVTDSRKSRATGESVTDSRRA